MIARLLEQAVQIPFAVADPHVQHVIDPHRNEPRLDFTGSGAGQPGFAATRRAVHQNPAANRFSISLVKLRMRQRMNYLEANFFFDLFHAAHVLEGGFRTLNLTLLRTGLVLP